MISTLSKFCLAVGALIGIVATVTPGLAQTDKVVPESRAQVTFSYAPVVKRTAPAVVNIYAKKVVKQRSGPALFDDPFFKRFFGKDFPFGGAPKERIQNSLGSGVLVRADGVVVTNNHVIADAQEITVVLSDRREFDAEIVLADDRTDLAVLRIVKFSDSDALEVGDIVLAIGNPFGVGQTVTSGIVSALARTRVGVADYRSFIQTDAAVNPGNSGGALVGMDGDLVGINTAIFSKSGGSLGIGFAVPANMVRETIYEGGPADEAGLTPGDVVMAVNGHYVEDAQALRFRLATRRIGETVELTVLRKGRDRTVIMPLKSPPEDPPRNTTMLEGKHPLAGARIGNLSPALVEELGLKGQPRGVFVLAVVKRSPAARLGVRPGDILQSVNGKEIKLVRDGVKVLKSGATSWNIAIRRGDRVLQVEVQ
jgi:serine protease Do